MKESIHSILKSDPFEDSLEVQGAAYLTRQAIQGPFSVLPPVTKIRGGREFVEGSCRSKKFMTKGVLVKKPVQVGAKRAVIFAHAAILRCLIRSRRLSLETCKRVSTREIGCLANVNLISAKPVDMDFFPEQ